MKRLLIALLVCFGLSGCATSSICDLAPLVRVSLEGYQAHVEESAKYSEEERAEKMDRIASGFVALDRICPEPEPEPEPTQ